MVDGPYPVSRSPHINFVWTLFFREICNNHFNCTSLIINRKYQLFEQNIKKAGLVSSRFKFILKKIFPNTVTLKIKMRLVYKSS